MSVVSLRQSAFIVCCRQIEETNAKFESKVFIESVFNLTGFCSDEQQDQVRTVLRSRAYWFLRQQEIIDKFPSEELLKIIAHDDVLCDELKLIELARVCAEDLNFQSWYAIKTGTIVSSRTRLNKLLNLLNAERVRTLNEDQLNNAKETLIRLWKENGISNHRGHWMSYLPRMEKCTEVVGIGDERIPWSPTRSLELMETSSAMGMELITFQVNKRRLLRWIIFSMEVGTNSQEYDLAHFCHCTIGQSDCDETMKFPRGVFDYDIFNCYKVFPVFEQVISQSIDYFELLPGISYTIKITLESSRIRFKPAFSNVSIRRLELRY